MNSSANTSANSSAKTSADKLPTLTLGNSLAGMLKLPTQLAEAVAGEAMSRTASGCEIPPPCWEPKHAGTCHLSLVPGNKALLRLHVMNCGWTRQVVSITGLGKLAGWMSFTPTTLLLDPQERATFIVSVQAPEWAKPGERLSGPVLVRGCRDHFVRVEIEIGDCTTGTCCDITINDCADQVHHWYDHFYCRRPCNTPRPPSTVGVRDG